MYIYHGTTGNGVTIKHSDCCANALLRIIVIPIRSCDIPVPQPPYYNICFQG